MLVIVEHRNIEFGAQNAFDFETFRRFDVFEVDAAEGGGEGTDDRDHFFHRGSVYFDIEHVHVGKFLEQHAFAFHDGLGGERTFVAQAENGCAVGDNADKVGFGGQLVSSQRVARDFDDCVGDAGGIGKREIALGLQRLGGDNLNFAGATGAMVFEHVLRSNRHVSCS